MYHVFKLLRPAHWLKNLFILAPLFFTATTRFDVIYQSFIGFVSFCLLSSVIYIFNDWRDIEADRLHKKKKLRPLAAGDVSPNTALFAACFLLLIVIFLIVYSDFPTNSILLMVIYGVVNLTYSLGLKQIPILELVLVSSGFVIRLIFGAEVINVDLSIWILVCTGLLATLIVVGKRRGDLIQGHDTSLKRRSLQGYNQEYLNQLLVIFSACIITSYLLFCASTYAIDKFGSDVLWTSIFVILGVLAYLKLLVVDQKGDDPVKLFLSNTLIQFIAGAWLVSFILVIKF